MVLDNETSRFERAGPVRMLRPEVPKTGRPVSGFTAGSAKAQGLNQLVGTRTLSGATQPGFAATGPALYGLPTRSGRAGLPKAATAEADWPAKKSDLEARLAWRPHRELPLTERVLKVGSAMLALKEIEYCGEPQGGQIVARVRQLIERILRPLEVEWLKERQSGDVVHRDLVEALAGEEFLGRLRDLLAAVGLAGVRRGRPSTRLGVNRAFTGCLRIGSHASAFLSSP